MHVESRDADLSLQDFSYELPSAQIAQYPAEKRQGSRLLSYRQDGSVLDQMMEDLPRLVPEGTLLVVNNSRVIAGRLHGHFSSGGRCELFLLEKPQGPGPAVVPCFAHPLRKLQVGKQVFLAAGLIGTVQEKPPYNPGSQGATPPLRVAFNCSGDELAAWLPQHGTIPLPPYIKRAVGSASAANSEDASRYQTVYARDDGSVAAPTAGLHFSEELLAALQARNIQVAAVTLHVGAGTFLPVKTEVLAAHEMHRERYMMPSATLNAILQAKKEKRKIILVGTTSLRCVESFYVQAGKNEEAMQDLADRWWDTQLFIYPRQRDDRYQPWVGDALFTNFHQPCSTLYMLVSALLGYDTVARVYRHALAEGYRFLSYGDASLLELPKAPSSL